MKLAHLLLSVSLAPFLSALATTPFLAATPYDPNRIPHGLLSDPSSPPNLYLLTYTNRLREEECSVLQTTSLLGYIVNVVGLYERVAHQTRGWLNTDKLDIVNVLARLQEKEPFAIVAFVDASDVVFQLPPEILVTRFLEYYRDHGRPSKGLAVWGAEGNCWPGGSNCKASPWVPDSVRATKSALLWPNSGAWVSHAGAMTEVLQRCLTQRAERVMNETGLPDFIESHLGSDQALFFFSLIHCRHDVPIALDYDQRLVVNMFSMEKQVKWHTKAGLWAPEPLEPLGNPCGERIRLSDSLEREYASLETQAREKEGGAGAVAARIRRAQREKAAALAIVPSAPVILHFPGKYKPVFDSYVLPVVMQLKSDIERPPYSHKYLRIKAEYDVRSKWFTRQRYIAKKRFEAFQCHSSVEGQGGAGISRKALSPQGGLSAVNPGYVQVNVGLWPKRVALQDLCGAYSAKFDL